MYVQEWDETEAFVLEWIEMQMSVQEQAVEQMFVQEWDQMQWVGLFMTFTHCQDELLFS